MCLPRSLRGLFVSSSSRRVHESERGERVIIIRASLSLSLSQFYRSCSILRNTVCITPAVDDVVSVHTLCTQVAVGCLLPILYFNHPTTHLLFRPSVARKEQEAVLLLASSTLPLIGWSWRVAEMSFFIDRTERNLFFAHSLPFRFRTHTREPFFLQSVSFFPSFLFIP